MKSKSSSANNDMDQDTYEQLMRVQISLDELKEKMDYIIDEIDELKKSSEKPCGDTQEKSRGHGQKERQDQNRIGNKSGAAEGSGFK